MERAELVADTGEVKVVGTMNPERFCRLLHELTKKSVRIVTQSNLSDGRIATSEQINNLFQQVQRKLLLHFPFQKTTVLLCN